MLSITKTRTTIIALVAALVALALPASALAESPTVWKYVGQVRDHRNTSEAAQPLPNSRYDLTLPESQVRHQTALKFGDLGCGGLYVGSVGPEWGSPGCLEWEFQRQPGHPATQLVTGTERVALYNAAYHVYLIREHHTFGISLGFSSTPSYEWQIADGQWDYAQLYNTNEHGYLVWAGVHPPLFGIDLRWLHAPYGLPHGYQPPPEHHGAPEGLPPGGEAPQSKPEAPAPERPKNAPETPPVTASTSPPPAK
jgi:hypothetical protein